MIQIILSILFFIWFFQRARNLGKNRWLWAVIGAVGFILASTAISQLILFVAAQLELERDLAIGALLVSIVAGLAVGAVVTLSGGNKFLPRADESEPA